MKGKPFLLGIGLLLMVGLLALLMQNRPEPCMKMEAKIELAKEFCDGLAKRAAEDRCSQLSDDIETMGQCMRVIVPSAHSACMGYIDSERLEQQYRSLCTQ